MPMKLNLNKASRRDRTKYYRLHKDHGHNMEEYKQLKVEIERLIQDGMLRRFFRKDWEERRPELEVRILINFDENEPVRFFHMITGGLSDSKGKNKCMTKDVLSMEKDLWTRQEVTFGPVIGWPSHHITTRQW